MQNEFLNTIFNKMRYPTIDVTARFQMTIPLYEQLNMSRDNVVCAITKASDQPVHTRSLVRAFVGGLNII